VVPTAALIAGNGLWGMVWFFDSDKRDRLSPVDDFFKILVFVACVLCTLLGGVAVGAG